jgi:LCP family protein required for cell wall assembly
VSNKIIASPARVITFFVVIFAVVFVGLVAANGYVKSGSPEAVPSPTPISTEIAVLPSETATEEAAEMPATEVPSRALPATSTPKATIQETSNPPIESQPEVPPSLTAFPTRTTAPTLTPTSRPLVIPSLPAGNNPDNSADPALPQPVPTFAVPENTTNILLLGSDVSLDAGIGRTDTMIIVAIDTERQTASMVSLPRDLYVYIPGWIANRLNTALSHGSSVGYPGGAIAQLTDTILYNFGVPIHFYAQVDFEGFKRAVDIVDGIDVPVSCQLRDWRLRSPELDLNNEDNWEMYTLEPGIHHMDGDMALWYVRSRRTTSDFDRGRRQQQMLRLMLNQGVDVGLLPSLPEMWNTYKDSVNTNMDIGRLLQLAALAPGVRENGVQHLYLVGDQLQPYEVPATGARVQLPIWENMEDTFRRLFLPPALNKATRPPITVEVINQSGNPDLALLAADNLEWYGFEPVITVPNGLPGNPTSISYYAQNFKGSYDWLLSWIFDKHKSAIELVPDTDVGYNYRVVLGPDYNPCRPQLFAPEIFLD